MSVGERIKEKRLEMGLSLEDLAKAIGVNRSTVKRYEDGKILRIPHNVIEMLAVILNTTPEYLMGWDNKSENSDLELDGEILILAREMQSLPKEKRSLLKEIVKSMSDIADKESEK